jgi:hypothetical protein
MAYTPDTQVAYTPDTQVKLYAGYTGRIESYTPDTQVKLYAGYTGQLLDARWDKTLKNESQKTIRRIHR